MTAKAEKHKATAARKLKEPPKTTRKDPTMVELPTPTEMAFVHILIRQKTRNVHEAARLLGLQGQQGVDMSKRARVRRYMHTYLDEFIRQMAEREVQKVIDTGITRDT